MTVTPIDKVLADGNCGEVTNRGEEARVQTCGATNRNRAYKAGAARWVGHASRSRFRPVAKAGTHLRWVGESYSVLDRSQQKA